MTNTKTQLLQARERILLDHERGVITLHEAQQRLQLIERTSLRSDVSAIVALQRHDEQRRAGFGVS